MKERMILDIKENQAQCHMCRRFLFSAHFDSNIQLF